MTISDLFNEITNNARLLIGSELHGIGANFNGSSLRDGPDKSRDKKVQKFDPHTWYGDLTIRFSGEGEFLSVITESARAYMGGPPIFWLELHNQSLPRIHANRYDRFGYLGPVQSDCRVFCLKWLELLHGEILTEVWAATGENTGLFEPSPCVCGIALKFVRDTNRHGSRVKEFDGPWYFGACFDPRDEVGELNKTILNRKLPELASGINPWEKLL